MKTTHGLLVVGLIAVGVFWLTSTARDRPQPDFGSGEVVVIDDIYDPVSAGEPTPEGFRQLLPRDAIHPIYNPTFRSGETTEWSSETLVVGLELGGEAKAYPVSFLNFREIVIDWIGGSPVLVSW